MNINRAIVWRNFELLIGIFVVVESTFSRSKIKWCDCDSKCANLYAEFVWWNIIHMVFPIIARHCDCASSWNQSLEKSRAPLFYIRNTEVAKDLVMHGTRAFHRLVVCKVFVQSTFWLLKLCQANCKFLVNRISGNDLLPDGPIRLFKAMLTPNELLRTYFNNISWKTYKCYSWQCIWKYHLQNCNRWNHDVFMRGENTPPIMQWIYRCIYATSCLFHIVNIILCAIQVQFNSR